MTEAVIVDVVRTRVGRGKPGGALSGVHPVDLLARRARRARVDRNDLDPRADRRRDRRHASARSASRATTSPATPCSPRASPRRCPARRSTGSAGRASRPRTSRRRACIAGAYDIVIACGVESMSRVPLGSSAARRRPLRLPRCARATPTGSSNQGVSAELIAAKWGFSRERARRVRRAVAPSSPRRRGESGAFATEVVPVPPAVERASHATRPCARARRPRGSPA